MRSGRCTRTNVAMWLAASLLTGVAAASVNAQAVEPPSTAAAVRSGAAHVPGRQFFMLRMLNRYRGELGVTAPGQELEAAAQATSNLPATSRYWVEDRKC